MGGKSSSKSKTATTNTDKRIANQDGVVLSDVGDRNTLNFNSTDAVKAIAQLGADTIRQTGGAVVDLTAYSIDRNLTSLDNTVNRATALTDSLIAKSYQNSQSAIKVANDTAGAAIEGANAQVAAANKAATKVTADTLEGARALIAQQQGDVRALAGRNSDLAFKLASDAVSAFQPGDNKASDNITKVGIAAAVAVAAYAIFV